MQAAPINSCWPPPKLQLAANCWFLHRVVQTCNALTLAGIGATCAADGRHIRSSCVCIWSQVCAPMYGQRYHTMRGRVPPHPNTPPTAHAGWNNRPLRCSLQRPPGGVRQAAESRGTRQGRLGHHPAGSQRECCTHKNCKGTAAYNEWFHAAGGGRLLSHWLPCAQWSVLTLCPPIWSTALDEEHPISCLAALTALTHMLTACQAFRVTTPS
jgi:hypothetical protein